MRSRRAGDHAAAQALVARRRAAAAGDRGGVRAAWRGPVAVRSSACAEDSEAASYAGQQETYLKVVGARRSAARIVDCWASFFSERALFYRAKKGSLDDLRHGRRRAADGRRREVRGPLHRRPGAAAPRPDDRRGDLRARRAGGLRRGDTGSLRARPRGRRKRERLVTGGVLEADELVALAQLGRLLEERFGGPQDIEWAIADGQIYLLQSRPVTAL